MIPTCNAHQLTRKFPSLVCGPEPLPSVPNLETARRDKSSLLSLFASSVRGTEQRSPPLDCLTEGPQPLIDKVPAAQPCIYATEPHSSRSQPVCLAKLLVSTFVSFAQTSQLKTKG